MCRDEIAVKNEHAVGGIGRLDVQRARPFESLERPGATDYFPEAVVVKLGFSVLARQEDRPDSPFDVRHVARPLGRHQIAARVATHSRNDVVAADFDELRIGEQTAAGRRAFAAHHQNEVAGADDGACLDVTKFDAQKHVFAAGKLSVVTTLNIAGWLRAGLSIETDKSLSAELGIIAGRNLRTGGSLRTNGGIRAGSRIDAGRNITAGDCITSAFAIVAGGDIRAEKGINSGSDFEVMAEAVEALDNDDSDDFRKKWIDLQKLWAASSSSESYWDAIVGERSPFGIEASGDIVAGTFIASATTIKAGDSIMAGEDIEAGRMIHSGGNVTAGRSINGGWKLSAEGSIQAGTEIIAAAIHAGGGIRAQGDILFTADLESGCY